MGLPRGAGIALPGGGKTRRSRPRSGVALPHWVAIGAPRGRGPNPICLTSRSGRRVQGSALAAGGPSSPGPSVGEERPGLKHRCDGLVGGPSGCACWTGLINLCQ